VTMSGMNNGYLEPVSNQVPARNFNDARARDNVSSPRDDWIAYPSLTQARWACVDDLPSAAVNRSTAKQTFASWTRMAGSGRKLPINHLPISTPLRAFISRSEGKHRASV